MSSRNARTAALRLSEVESASDEVTRYIDCCIVVRRRQTGEDLLEVGGKWDRVERKYVGDAKRRHVIFANESQVELCLALRDWLTRRISSQDRDIIHFAGVKRGGGKTHWFVLALAIIAVALPNAVTWAVSPTNAKRDEIERILRGQFPKNLGWWIYRGHPEPRLTWITGSILRLLSGEVPETVKQGGAEAVFVNEAQDQDKRVYTLGLPAIRNNEGRPAGILLVAANPPERVRGEWVNDLAEKLKTSQIGGGRYFDVDPALNSSIEQRAVDLIAKAVEHIDPIAAKRDLGGQWLPVGDRAYSLWRARDKVIDDVRYPGLVGIIPDLGYVDVTSEALRQIGAFRPASSERPPYQYAIGADFQGRPHMAALVAKIYRGPDGRRIYYFLREFVVPGDEHDLSDEIQESDEFSPDNAVIIGDASGDWQAGKDRRRKIPSWEALKVDRWMVYPPQEKIRPDSKHASNGPVDTSISQMYVMMREGRILVHPGCRWLIESFEKCPMARHGARIVIPSNGGYSHITDCARYIVRRFEPKPKKPSTGRPPAAGSFPAMRPGADFKL